MDKRAQVIIGVGVPLLLGLGFAGGHLVADDSDRISVLEEDLGDLEAELASTEEELASAEAFVEQAAASTLPGPGPQPDPFPGPAAGAGGKAWNSLFPRAKEDRAGAYAPVRDNAEAVALCEAAHRRWPRKYGLYSEIRFAAPDSADDLYCQR